MISTALRQRWKLVFAALTLAPGAAASQVPPPISVVPVPPPAPEERPERYPAPAEVMNDPASWITSSDYPPQALRERREGRVEFEVTVFPNGNVRDCRVLRGSGFGELDEATCLQIRRRARFRPAYDSVGRAVEGTYRNAVEWRLPALPPNQTFSAEFRFTVDAEGTMRDCRVIEMTGGVPAALLQNNPCSAPVRYQPYRNEAGQPVSKEVTMTFGASVADPAEE